MYSAVSMEQCRQERQLSACVYHMPPGGCPDYMGPGPVTKAQQGSAWGQGALAQQSPCLDQPPKPKYPAAKTRVLGLIVILADKSERPLWGAAWPAFPSICPWPKSPDPLKIADTSILTTPLGRHKFPLIYPGRRVDWVPKDALGFVLFD